MGKAGRIFVLTALMVGALLAAPAAHAKLKATNVVYAWDRTALRYQNSNVVIYWDNGWVPFIHKIGFDNGNYTSPTVCPTSSTDYAGIMEFGLYNEDNNPAGADGFLRTRDWKLVYCNRTGDGDFTNDDLSV